MLRHIALSVLYVTLTCGISAPVFCQDSYLAVGAVVRASKGMGYESPSLGLWVEGEKWGEKGKWGLVAGLGGSSETKNLDGDLVVLDARVGIMYQVSYRWTLGAGATLAHLDFDSGEERRDKSGFVSVGLQVQGAPLELLLYFPDSSEYEKVGLGFQYRYRVGRRVWLRPAVDLLQNKRQQGEGSAAAVQGRLFVGWAW